MLKLFKNLKESIVLVVIVVALLFVQAYCDLSLPSYTSDIVNVGIAQNGIDSNAVEAITENSMNQLMIFMNEEDKATVTKYYDLIEKGDSKYTKKYNAINEENIYVRNTDDKDAINDLEDIFTKPMIIVSNLNAMEKEIASLKEGEEPSESVATIMAMKQQLGIPTDTPLIDGLAMLPEDVIEQMSVGMTDKFDNLPDSMATSAAVSYVKTEYKNVGISVKKIQNNFLFIAGAKMLALSFIGMIASIIVVYLSSIIAAKLSMRIRDKVFKKVVGFSNAEFDKFSTASLITRTTNDIQQIQMFVTMLFRIVIYAPILGIGGVFKVINTNSNMAWIIALAVGVIMVVVGTLFGVAMPKFKKLQDLVDRLNLVMREILTGIPVIRAFSTEKHEEERFDEANKNFMKVNLFVNRVMTFMMPTMMFIMNAVSILIVYKGAYGIDDGSMQVGDLMAFIQYTMQIILAFLMICMVSIILPRASVSANRIVEVLETEEIIHDPINSKISERNSRNEVEFKNVSFSYSKAEEKVLSDVSFIAKEGETTAIIGSTGSGKSTLINLIPRFYDVSEGSILINGVDIRDINQSELREQIGYVPQKGVLFSGTIESNIKYGRNNATDDEVVEAATIAQAIEFINDKPEKYDSAISQGGTNVSGGQKQRLSIARAIAKKPNIYIFDDSFSALDFKTDVTLRRALSKVTMDSIVFIVAQRISTILHANQIIVLDEGQVAGIGTHEELLDSCEVYKQIALSQLSQKELDNNKQDQTKSKEV